MTATSSADTWASRDLVFLRELVAQIEREPRTPISAINIGTNLSMAETDVVRALHNLKRGGYVVDRGGPTRVGRSAINEPLDFTDKALYAVGAWPTADTAADRLIAALEALSERGSDEPTRTRARGALEQIGGFGRDTLAAITATVITGQLPGGPS